MQISAFLVHAKTATAYSAVIARRPGHRDLGIHCTEPVNSHLSDPMESLRWDMRGTNVNKRSSCKRRPSPHLRVCGQADEKRTRRSRPFHFSGRSSHRRAQGVITAARLDRPMFRLELIAQVNPWIIRGSSWQRMPSASTCRRRRPGERYYGRFRLTIMH
jgi:hypothetical protein